MTEVKENNKMKKIFKNLFWFYVAVLTILMVKVIIGGESVIDYVTGEKFVLFIPILLGVISEEVQGGITMRKDENGKENQVNFTDKTIW